MYLLSVGMRPIMNKQFLLLILIAELLCGRRPQSGAPWVRKLGNLSIREILALTSAYAQPYRLWGRREGSPKATGWGVENANFSWREIAPCFWATGVFLARKSHDQPSILKKRFL